MKAAFFSIAAMAVSVFAAPAPQGTVQGAVEAVENAVIPSNNGGLGVGKIVEDATGNAKRGLASAADAATLLNGALSQVTTHTSAINKTVSDFQANKVSKADAQSQAAEQLALIHYSLTDVLTNITSAAGLTVAKGDIDTLLTLVIALVAEILATVKSIVIILGVSPQLNSILHSVLSLVSAIVLGLLALLSGLLPGLVAGLSPLLAGLGNGVLAPLLTAVAGLLAGLNIPSNILG